MKERSPIRIGFAPYDIRYTFWALLAHALRQAAKERGVAIETVPIISASEAAAVLEHFLSQGVDAVIMAPPRADYLECASLVHQAQARGIPVVALDSLFPGGVETYVVRSDNAGGAALVAERLLARVQRGPLVHLHGP
ncbi:MAG TPA: substrate-binding domain-containing protein, partial [Roseiflexaceae bacterium]|nr:substrate-binding domain-containing protein [Roseiflexaceae bacterium]